MPNVGGHDHYMFHRDGLVFKISFGDCEYRESRRFLDGLSNSNLQTLFNAIKLNIWDANRYGVQQKTYDTYIIGQDNTQDFINHCPSDFWSLVPFQLICLSAVSFHPFNCNDCRWNILLEFGSANEFKYTNCVPNKSNSN